LQHIPSVVVVVVVQDYLGSKLHPSVLETVGLRVPALYTTDFELCSMYVPQAKIVLLLDALQLLILFARMLAYLDHN
jgi:hypothetical protein